MDKKLIEGIVYWISCYSFFAVGYMIDGDFLFYSILFLIAFMITIFLFISHNKEKAKE